MTTVSRRDHDQARREGQALARRRDRLAARRWPAAASLPSPRSRRHWTQDVVRVEAEVERVVAQEALGVDRARAAPCSRRARGRRGSGPGSWCRARPGRGRRPCARARRRAVPGRRRRRLGGDAPAGVGPVDPDRSLELLAASSSVVPVEARRRSPAGARRVVAAEHLPGIRAVERPDVAARLQLVDHPGGPRIADLQASLEERR